MIGFPFLGGVSDRAAGFMTGRALFIGIDASLTSTGVAAITTKLSSRKSLVIARTTTATIRTSPEASKQFRLRYIHRSLSVILDRCRSRGIPVHVSIEGYARGAKFRREEMGEVCGVIYCAIGERWEDADIYRPTPRAVKETVCPNWPGLSRENWERAGITKKYKRSMPSKSAVASSLFRLYGVRGFDSHTVDAACVAIAHIHSLGFTIATTEKPHG